MPRTATGHTADAEQVDSTWTSNQPRGVAHQLLFVRSDTGVPILTRLLCWHMSRVVSTPSMLGIHNKTLLSDMLCLLCLSSNASASVGLKETRLKVLALFGFGVCFVGEKSSKRKESIETKTKSCMFYPVVFHVALSRFN